MNPDLTDEETAALLRELDSIIDSDRYFLSTRIKTLKAIRAKIRPEPVRDPLPPPPKSLPLFASPPEGDSKGFQHVERAAPECEKWLRERPGFTALFCAGPVLYRSTDYKAEPARAKGFPFVQF